MGALVFLSIAFEFRCKTNPDVHLAEQTNRPVQLLLIVFNNYHLVLALSLSLSLAVSICGWILFQSNKLNFLFAIRIEHFFGFAEVERKNHLISFG